MRTKSLRPLFRRLLTSLIFLGCTVTVAALPELHTRQECDTAVCPDWSWLSTIGEKAQDTWQSISGYLGGLLLKDLPEGEQIPTNPTQPIPPGSGQSINPQNPWDTEPAPQIEIFSGTEECPVGAPDANYDSNDQSQLRQCSVVPAQIVVPTDCTSPQNALVAQKLAVMDPSFKTSRSPRCPGENGVVFWLAYITPDQAASILAETDGAVKGITPDSPFNSGPLTPAPELITSHGLIPRKPKIGNRLKKKRGVLEVEVHGSDDLTDPSLAFLSIPPGQTYGYSKKYAFFNTAVQSALRTDIRVYLVDSGYDPSSLQIRQKGLEWLYGIGASRRKNDNHPNRHGTCMASKISGPENGVFPRGPVFTIVKTSDTLASFIDSLGYILEDVIDKKASVGGRAVVHISGQWLVKRPEYHIIDLMRDGIYALLESKIMVVSSSPHVSTGVDTWPASLSRVSDMITVGSVSPLPLPGIPYGSRYPWSLGSVTVNAPGGGFCKTTGGVEQPMVGPGMAAAVTTGLIAYFLAIPDLQEYFLAQPNWASAVKRYVVAMSYPRYELAISVWNGLDVEDGKTTHNTPGDPWIGIPYPGNPRFQ